MGWVLNRLTFDLKWPQIWKLFSAPLVLAFIVLTIWIFVAAPYDDLRYETRTVLALTGVVFANIAVSIKLTFNKQIWFLVSAGGGANVFYSSWFIESPSNTAPCGYNVWLPSSSCILGQAESQIRFCNLSFNAHPLWFWSGTYHKV